MAAQALPDLDRCRPDEVVCHERLSGLLKHHERRRSPVPRQPAEVAALFARPLCGASFLPQVVIPNRHRSVLTTVIFFAISGAVVSSVVLDNLPDFAAICRGFTRKEWSKVDGILMSQAAARQIEVSVDHIRAYGVFDQDLGCLTPNRRPLTAMVSQSPFGKTAS